MSERVIVCGGRDFHDGFLLAEVLRQELNLDDTVIVGGARGADKMAEQWAREQGFEVVVFPAQWDKFGKKAGFLRNTQMLEEGEATRVIAFPGGVGTQMMMDIARRAHVEVLEVSDEYEVSV